MWGASSRLQWDVTKSFYLGVEVMYNHMNSASSFNGLVPRQLGRNSLPRAGAGSGAGVPVGGNNVENAWNVTVRMHKDFLP